MASKGATVGTFVHIMIKIQDILLSKYFNSIKSCGTILVNVGQLVKKELFSCRFGKKKSHVWNKFSKIAL